MEPIRSLVQEGDRMSTAEKVEQTGWAITQTAGLGLMALGWRAVSAETPSIVPEGGWQLSTASPYAGLRDPVNVGIKPFTPRQHREALAANRAAHGGVLQSDKSGRVLVKPQQSRRGVTPPSNEAHLDHVLPMDASGTNSFRNLQILARDENIAKRNWPDFP